MIQAGNTRTVAINECDAFSATLVSIETQAEFNAVLAFLVDGECCCSVLLLFFLSTRTCIVPCS